MAREIDQLPARVRAYLGSVVGNAWQDFTGQGRGSATAALWADIRAAAEATGLPRPSFGEVNAARAWAARQPAAAAAFRRAGDTETDWSRMTTTVANSRALNERNAAPRFVAYWQMDRTVDGETVTEWRMNGLGRTPPTDVGFLRDQLMETAQMEYGELEDATFNGVAFIAEL